MGRGNSGLFSGTKGAKDGAKAVEQKKPVKTTKEVGHPLIDEALIKELETNKIKFTREDIVFITRDKTGQIVWLEKGNSAAGLQHIRERHEEDFVRKHGVTSDELPKHLVDIFSCGKVEYSRLKEVANRKGIERLYFFDGKYYMLSGVGTNGFVTSAYPVDEPTARKLIVRYKK